MHKNDSRSLAAWTTGWMLIASCLGVLPGCTSSNGGGDTAQGDGGSNGGSVKGTMTGTGLLPFSIPDPIGNGEPQQYGDFLWTFDLTAIGDGTGISEIWSVTFKKGVTLAVGTFHESDLDNDGLVLNLADGGSAVNDTATNTGVDKLTTDPVTLIITSTSVDSNGTTVAHGSVDATFTYSQNASGTEHLTATF